MRITLARSKKVKLTDKRAQVTIGRARPRVKLNVDVQQTGIFDETFDSTFE